MVFLLKVKRAYQFGKFKRFIGRLVNNRDHPLPPLRDVYKRQMWNGERCEPEETPVIETYEDHRMAMAFAPAIIRHPNLLIAVSPITNHDLISTNISII